jgi:autotransporter translocation and assembly factor TamB
MMRSGGRRKGRTSVRLLLWTAVLTAAVVVASLLALQTRAAKDRLAAWLTTLTADSATARVVFGRIDGRLPFDARVATVTIADDEGVWLSIEGVELDLAVSALLLGQVRYRSPTTSRRRSVVCTAISRRSSLVVYASRARR